MKIVYHFRSLFRRQKLDVEMAKEMRCLWIFRSNEASRVAVTSTWSRSDPAAVLSRARSTALPLFVP